jgi:CPA2 family monovalent cation:H+ antiporter-2
MEHALITTLIAGLVTAFICAIIAKKLHLPPLLGYLFAGILIGPHTPGFVADISLAQQLAEIGIILLMFGVGMHFSLRDLVAMRKLALPGAAGQMLSATLVGAWLAHYLGQDWPQALIFGFSLSVASTVVLLRALEDYRLLNSAAGKLAIGWLVVEDIAMVFALVLLPVLADAMQGPQVLSWKDLLRDVLEVFVKIAAFFICMMVVGRRFLPGFLVMIAKMRSPELNTLGTLAIALGFASIAYFLFDASLALGAFLAGVVLNESEIGHKSAESSLPMRDAFAVLFFVSVGMLFDPRTLLTQPWAVGLTVTVIILAKGAAAWLITAWFKRPMQERLVVSIGLAQIGEFSFILGSLALTRGVMDPGFYNILLAGAMVSILVNPLLFRLYGRWHRRHFRQS